MNSALPTTEELEKLTVRSVVAYAARTARRISLGLRDIIADDIIDNALCLTKSVCTTDRIGEVDQASIISAAARVAGAYAAAPDEVKSRERFRMVFSLMHAALAATSAVEAAVDPRNAILQMKNTVQEAERAVRALEVLNSMAASAAMEAARQDYNILLREYGEHHQVIIGNQIY